MKRMGFLFRISMFLTSFVASLPQAHGQVQMQQALEMVYQKADTAAEAAADIMRAEEYRRKADELADEGQQNEARSHLYKAKAIALGSAERDALFSSDPLREEYARQLETELLNFDFHLDETAPRASHEKVEQIHSMYPFIAGILAAHNLPRDLAAVAVVESAGNPLAISSKGARGLWQLMPQTARRYGLRVNESVDDRIDPIRSTYAAARYLQDLYRLFQDWPLALAAYNAGENRLQSAMQRTGMRSFYELADKRVLPKETRLYVPSVIKLLVNISESAGTKSTFGP